MSGTPVEIGKYAGYAAELKPVAIKRTLRAVHRAALWRRRTLCAFRPGGRGPLATAIFVLMH